MQSRIGAVLTATLLWTLALVAPAHAAFPGANGKIAFQSDRSGVDKIYTANSDGTDVRELVEGPYSGGQGAQNDPVWSPDGSQIGFYCAEPVCIVNADGTGWHTIGLSDGTRPTWSPDGT